MKKLFLIFTLLILLSSSANASLEADWLLSKSSNNKWNTIEETAYAVLALKTESTKYSSQISKAVQILKANLDNCIPNNECNVKEAALSILAIKDSVANLDIYTTWLINSRSIQYSGELTGWKVQIISPTKSGSCILNNTEIEQAQTINVVKGDYTPWVEILPTVLIINTKSLELDCSSLQATDLILSLIQEKQEQGVTYYYIKQEEHSKQKITVDFGNPCWGSDYRSNCDKDTTSLVLYTFKQLNKQPIDSTWLKQQSLTPLQNAFLYKITQDQKYFDAVKLAQTTVGDWDQDVYQTAMIAYLLKPSTFLDKSYSWINSNKNPQNCWPSLSCKVITTSAVLMSQAVTQITIIDTDNDGIDDNWETTYCNGNCAPNADPDKDGLTNLQEYQNGTDPNKADTDGDKFNDKQEIDAKTNPNDINDYPTEKKKEEEKDSDGDGYTDKEEITAGTNPLDSSDYPGSEPGGTIEDHIYGEDCTTDVGCKGKYNLFEVCEDIPGDSCPFSDTAISTTTKPLTKEPEKGRSTLFWFLIVLLLLIVLIGGGFLAYKKGLLKFKFGKKPSKPSLPTYTPKLKPIPKTQYKPVMKTASHKSPFRKHIEESLEKSMKEMEELLKK